MKLQDGALAKKKSNKNELKKKFKSTNFLRRGNHVTILILSFNRSLLKRNSFIKNIVHDGFDGIHYHICQQFKRFRQSEKEFQYILANTPPGYQYIFSLLYQ